MIKTWLLFAFILTIYFCLVFKCSTANIQQLSQIKPGFQASPKEWMNHNGMFLVSKNSNFSFGFYTSVDAPFYVLVVMHIFSSTNIWTANRGVLVDDSSKFVFAKNGNAYLHNTTSIIWSTNTTQLGVQKMELKDNGNLILFSENQTIIWQSFDHPTDTLVSGQSFSKNMRLKSFPNDLNMHYHLKIKFNDLILFAGYKIPQIYWSMLNDSRKTVIKPGGKVSYATILGNSWNFYDAKGDLVWQFNMSDRWDSNAFWAAVLGSNGSVEFFNLLKWKSESSVSVKIPAGTCATLSSCSPYKSCFMENLCQCPVILKSLFSDCKPGISISCDNPQTSSSVQLLDVGSRFDYSALRFTKPQLRSSLSECKTSCLQNCSCIAMFYENSSRSCFMFGKLGSLRHPDFGATSYFFSIKVSKAGDSISKGLLPARGNGFDFRSTIIVIIIIIGTLLIVSCLIGFGFWYYHEKRRLFVLETRREASEEDNFFENMTGLPVRYSYNDLEIATKNFSEKLGQGGFGSVYLGVLDDGTKLAVKKLEGIGQGKKHFRAEVSIIGSVHHVHLVKLKGFCAEGVNHRLLVYEYMEKGSLDRWIFCSDSRNHVFLDWETRFNIALGTAKGLAYLHDQCDAKIIHCDIKPENVLLDENFAAKVSDFGLAKLMNKEQSHVFTTLRGTRGYLAPEWITHCTISEKSDVYSYGMVLLEIIGGRKNYDPSEPKEKAHLPSFAFKMMEQGQMNLILDPRLKVIDLDPRVNISIKVALWCIQDDKSLRPSMTRVVQMLEGLCPVLRPPIPSKSASRIFSSLLRNSGTKSQILSWRSARYSSIGRSSVSEVQLSGPR